MSELTGYELSRAWFDFAFERPEVKPHHTALYFWIIERANRSGWKEHIDLPTDYSMEAAKIGNYNTYKRCLTDLSHWGFIAWTHTGHNQHSCNKVRLCRFRNDEAPHKALDKALLNHDRRQRRSSEAIYKPLTPNPGTANPETSPAGRDMFGSTAAESATGSVNTPLSGKKERKASAQKKESPALSLPWPGEAFAQLWGRWKSYRRKQHGFRYKSVESEQAALNRLAGLARGEENTAHEILLQAMAGGWKGFFGLQEQKPKTKQANGKQTYSPDRLQAAIRRNLR